MLKDQFILQRCIGFFGQKATGERLIGERVIACCACATSDNRYMSTKRADTVGQCISTQHSGYATSDSSGSSAGNDGICEAHFLTLRG
jgi:hypothetical protein